MGRTLHYTMKRDKGNFTRKEIEAIYKVSSFYNSPELLKEINITYKTKLKELWTCENFWLGIGNYYPNWEHKNIKGVEVEIGWAIVNAKMKIAEKETGNFIDAVYKVQKDGYIIFHHDEKNEFHGFTKIQGNEFNSLLVFKALIEISKRVPTAIIEVYDEGEFLLCPLKLKKGKVLPMVKDLVDGIQNWSKNLLLSENFGGNILKDLKNTDFKSKIFKKEIGFESPYDNETSIKCIEDSLRNLKEIETVLLKVIGGEGELYFYNIENRHPSQWFEAELFVRPVDVEKFLNYEMSAGTMMDGFLGEGFNLTDKDSEAESYKKIAQMFSMLEKAGFDKKNVQILGE